MLTAFRIFFGAKGSNKFLVLLCLMLAGMAEGLGFATLLPLLNAAQGESLNADSPINQIILSLLGFLGLEPELGVLLALIAAAILVKSALMILAMTQVGFAVAKVATDLRRKVISKLLKVQWSYFVSQPIGRFANVISLEATRSGNAFLQAALLISLIAQTCVYVAVAILMSLELGILALAVGGGIALALSWLLKMARAAGRRQTSRNVELVSQLTDALGGIKALKAMARQDHLQSFFTEKIGDLESALRREVISKQALKNLQEPLLILMLCIGFYVAITQLGTDFSELLVIGLLIERTVSSMNKASLQLQKTMIQESAYLAIRGVIDETKAEREVSTGKKIPSLNKGISLEKLHFAYDNGKVVFSGVTLEIPANKLTVLTGPSGTGKTTLTDLILGLQHPDSGQVLIDDLPLDEVDMRAWRHMVGYVPQELFLFHESVLENVRLGDERLSEETIIQALKDADAWRFVEQLPQGLYSTVGERGAKLSGGQRQRIALARALVHKPKLLILDEVTSALDPDTEIEICRSIQKLSREHTVISITHRPAWLTAADKVYELSGTGVYELPTVIRADAAK